MSLKDVFEKRVARAAKALERPDSGPIQIRFSSEDLLNDARLDSLHGQFPGKEAEALYLYQISLDGGDLDVEKIRVAFRTARSQRRWNMSRDNVAHGNSKSLYVGTCEDLYSRFRTHLGKGEGTQTWSLYLSKWSIPQARFSVEYYRFRETLHEDVELIEGVLWDSLKPLFGKKGGRGS